jgi:hypothetical protein
MKRALFGFVTLLAIGLMAGCGSSYGGGSTGGGGGNQPNALNGQYAFVLTGFDTDSSGSAVNPVSMAGSFKADGLGHIMAGAVDVNDNGVVSKSSSLAGTYSFDANGLGGLGTITLTNSVGTLPHPLVFGFALQASGEFGDIMSLDNNNFIATGTMQQQNSAVFTLSSLAGDYIITLNGRNATVPTSALGRFTLGASGASTSVLFDRSIAGVGTAVASSAVVTLASTGPDTNGRGTLTLTITDALNPAAGTQNFAYYAITANRFVAVETDATGTMIADASRQTTLSSFTATTVNTAGSVFGVAGVDTTKSDEITAVGQLQITGPTAGTLHLDSNNNGAIVSSTTLPIQTISFDSTTGRGTITAAAGFSNGLFDSAVFYLTASGTGFILDAEPGSSNRAMAGTLSSQSGSPFALSTISGPMILRTRGSSVNDAQSLVGVIAPISTPGDYVFDVDQSVPTTTFGPFSTVTDSGIQGIMVLTLDTSTGRGTLSIPTGGVSTATEVFYVIGPNQMVFIDVSPAGSPNNGASPLFFVNPH